MGKSSDEILLDMQRASKERHRNKPVEIVPAVTENTSKENETEVVNKTTVKITAERAVEILKEAGIEFVKAKEYLPKKAKVPKEPKPERKVARPVKEHLVKSMFDTPQKPTIDFNTISKHTSRARYDPKIRMSDIPRVHIPDKEIKPFKRPPAVYDNKKSLYGIDYNDL